MRANATWMHDWIDEAGIHNVPDAERVLASQFGLKRLAEFAARAESSWQYATPRRDRSILAAGEMNPTGGMACMDPTCRERAVDELFHRVWPYFDAVVLASPSARQVLNAVEKDESRARVYALGEASVLLRARAIGADDYIEYVDDRVRCEHHWTVDAREFGLGHLIDEGAAFAKKMAVGARFEVEEAGGRRRFYFRPAEFETGTLRFLDPGDDRDEEALRKAAAQSYVGMLATRLVNDFAAARDLSLPLGGFSRVPAAASVSAGDVTAASVAFNLELPHLRGVPTQQLIQVIEEDRTAFDSFRTALRRAVEEKISATRSGDDPRQIAARVLSDYLEPELDKLNRQLVTAERRAVRKTATDVGLGTIFAVVGSMLGLPLGIAGGGAALVVGAAAKHVDEYWDARRDVELSDLYFLWKAERVGHPSP